MKGIYIYIIYIKLEISPIVENIIRILYNNKLIIIIKYAISIYTMDWWVSYSIIYVYITNIMIFQTKGKYRQYSGNVLTLLLNL